MLLLQSFYFESCLLILQFTILFPYFFDTCTATLIPFHFSYNVSITCKSTFSNTSIMYRFPHFNQLRGHFPLLLYYVTLSLRAPDQGY